jgi:hypothetical protein
MRWLRFLVWMWLLVRIDDAWDLVIIGGYDTQQACRTAQERSLWGSRVLCAPSRLRATSLDALQPQLIDSPTPRPGTPPREQRTSVRSVE